MLFSFVLHLFGHAECGFHLAILEVGIGGMVFIDERKIELLLGKICACHLDCNRVTEAVAHLLAPSDEAIVLLVEFVEIILKVANGHKSLALVFVEFYI